MGQVRADFIQNLLDGELRPHLDRGFENITRLRKIQEMDRGLVRVRGIHSPEERSAEAKRILEAVNVAGTSLSGLDVRIELNRIKENP
jgi:hypothetical protein